MCVGIVPHQRLVRARASGPGNPVMLVGADTGRDGIHGATFASAVLDERAEERRPAVQVGNPFLEKLLLEACLELLDGEDVVAMQDLGAAGLTSSSVELAARGGCGIEIDVARVSRREAGMTPYEVMLSESQERMLVVVRRGAEERVRRVFRRWGLWSDVVGTITDDGMIRVRDGSAVVAELPVRLLTDDVPTYEREGRAGPAPEPLRADLSDVPPPSDLGEVLLRLLASPNLCSRRWIYEQYDHTVQTNTVVPPGEGAAVVRVKGTRRGLALTTDCNARYCLLDPRRGAAIAVAEAARNVVCCGARPLAITDCLNFGDPTRPEIYYQLREAVLGLADACRALDVPIVSGNVSLYNETEGVAVSPTPVVGMLGLLEDVGRAVRSRFRQAGDAVVLLGPVTAEIGASEYLAVVHERVAGPVPRLDLDVERRLQRCLLDLVEAGLVVSAHDVSEGGLAVALAECAAFGGVGCRVDPDAVASLLDLARRADAALFGEGQSRVVISCRADDVARVRSVAEVHGVPSLVLGATGGDRLVIGDLVDLSLEQVRRARERGVGHDRARDGSS
jgi:phosphoribosylformylglycinamidine synthase